MLSVLFVVVVPSSRTILRVLHLFHSLIRLTCVQCFIHAFGCVSNETVGYASIFINIHVATSIRPRFTLHNHSKIQWKHTFSVCVVKITVPFVSNGNFPFAWFFFFSIQLLFRTCELIRRPKRVFWNQFSSLSCRMRMKERIWLNETG